MLVHHTDAERDGLLRVIDGNFLSVDEDLSGSRPVHAVQYVHERRLAGTILAEDRVDLALVHGQVDVVIRSEVSELLHDVLHLDDDSAYIHVAFHCIVSLL